MKDQGTERGPEEARKQSRLQRLISWQNLITITFLAIGLVSLLLTYLTLQEPKPGVIIETISDTNILDLRRPLQDLNIVFRGHNVQEQNLNLRIVTINVVNSGEVDILPTHYDLADDWGIKFKDGEVIEARLVGTNSEYLRAKIVPQRLGVDTVAFPKVIFEQGNFFAIEVLLLHPKNDSPSMSSVGKIAGINEITVLTRPLSKQETSFVTELFQGRALIQVVRAFIYFVGSLLVIVALILAMVGIEIFPSKLRALRRRNRILQTRTIRQMDQDEARKFLVGLYESDGPAGLKGLQELTEEPGRIRRASPSDRWISREHRWIASFNTLNNLATMGILEEVDDDNAFINPTFREAVDKLVAELED